MGATWFITKLVLTASSCSPSSGMKGSFAGGKPWHGSCRTGP